MLKVSQGSLRPVLLVVAIASITSCGSGGNARTQTGVVTVFGPMSGRSNGAPVKGRTRLWC